MKVKSNIKDGKNENALRGPRNIKKMKTPAKKISGIANVKVVKKNGAAAVSPSQVISKKQVQKVTSTLKDISKNDISTLKKLDISSDIIKQCVSAVTQIHNEHKNSGKSSLLNDKDSVYLQLALMKIPEVPDPRRKYVTLHHGLFGDDPEVCLFVKDYIPYDKVQRTPDEKIEVTIDYYQELLKLHGVNNISTIMPMFQLKTEYDSYQLKRKLVDRFDLFLSQSNLLDHDNYFKHLGIAFTKKNKVPLVLKFPHNLQKADPKFAEHVASLLRTTWYTLKPHSDTLSVRIGNVGHTNEELIDNLRHVLYQLTEETDDAIPGGVRNVRSIMIKTSRSKAVPLYMNLASSSDIPVPVLKSVKAVGQVVEGELSTQIGKKVTVTPNGQVFVVPNEDELVLKGWRSDDESDGEEEDEKDEEALESSSDERLESQDAKVDTTLANKNKLKRTAKLTQQQNQGSDEDDAIAEKRYRKSNNDNPNAKKKNKMVKKINTKSSFKENVTGKKPASNNSPLKEKGKKSVSSTPPLKEKTTGKKAAAKTPLKEKVSSTSPTNKKVAGKKANNSPLKEKVGKKTAPSKEVKGPQVPKIKSAKKQPSDKKEKGKKAVKKILKKEIKS